jgi:3-keto-disaccharide hydrolase
MRLRVLFVMLFAALPAVAQADKDGFTPLFNGKDLSGWVPVNVHPKSFFVKDGEIITTGQPIGYMRSEKQYENFILEMEWMHVNKHPVVGNSGLFVWGDTLPVPGSPFTRGIEVQVLVNLEYKDKKGQVTATSHGDVFAIQGATCKPDRPHPNGSMRCLPSEYRAKGGGEWNHYRVEAKDGVIKLSVNGKEVSGVSECKPRKGYLALESEGAECHFKNIKIKELPSSNPKPEEIASPDPGYKLLFNGLDLDGWDAGKNAWTAGGGRMRAGGETEIRSKAELGAVELIFDWRLPKGTGEASVTVAGKTVALKPKAGSKGGWAREVIKVEASEAKTGPVVFKPVPGMEFMNVFVRELK